MSEDAKAPLRWVRYDGVYYAALLVPPEEGPVEVPAGHSFVFFLDGESGAVVPNADIEPYDPTDSVKANHPAAAAGVALAGQILYGSQEAAAQDSGAAAVATVASEALPGGKRRHNVLDDDDELEVMDAEEEDENLLQMFTREAAPDEPRSQREESADAEGSGGGTAASRPPRKIKREVREGKRHKHQSSRNPSEDGQAERSGEQADANLFTQPVNWSTMEEEEYMTNMSPHTAAALHDDDNGRRTQRHVRGTKAAVDMSSALSALHARGSLAMPYAAEVRHYYNIVLDEASAEGKVVSVSEVDVVRALERRLREVQAKAAYLERLHERRVGQSTVLSNAERRDADAALQEALRQLQDSTAVETLVRAMVHPVVANPPAHDTRPRRHSRVERLAFHDASTAFLLQTTITTATPRELTQELANKYRDQRLHRDRVLSYSQGLGKTGLYGAAPKLMENWSRARELMVLAQPQENQPVKPTGYVARRFADSITKVGQYALKRLSASTRHSSQDVGRQRGVDGLGFDAFASPGAQGFLAGGLPSDMTGGNSTVADLLLSYQSQTRRSRQSYPAYYNFHDLHSDQAEQDAMLYRTSSAAPGAPTAATLVDHFLDEPSLSIVPEGNAALITPLQGDFDPRVDFAIDPKEVREGRGVDMELSMTASYLPSTSLRMPSQESQLYSLLSAATSDVEGAPGRSNASYSRASSVASSVLYSEGGSQGRLRRSRRHARRPPTAPSITSAAGGPTLSWRDAAKRAILEQLTLYLRGLKGRPAVLSEDDFETVARRLLERAVRRESEQTGVSMALQANNMTMPFDKKTRISLKRSVDNYVQRHYLASEVNSSARPGSQPYYRQPGEVPLPQPPEEDAEESTKVYREADDAPVYDA